MTSDQPTHPLPTPNEVTEPFWEATKRHELEADFQAFHWLELQRRDFDLATELGFVLRRQGLTIPATDLMIAASGIRADARLLHRDRHFDQVAQHSELKFQSFAPS